MICRRRWLPRRHCRTPQGEQPREVAIAQLVAAPSIAGTRCDRARHSHAAHASAYRQAIARYAAIDRHRDALHRWDVGFWGTAYADYNSPQMAFATSGTAVYCQQAHTNYDPSSGTYVGRDGLRHPCP
jgi:hypothetical protein